MNPSGNDNRGRSRTVSRRGLLRAAGGAAVGAIGLGLAGCDNGEEQVAASPSPAATAKPTAASSVIGPVDQRTQARRGTGLIAWDPTKTSDGYTLFAPLGGASAYVISMEGESVHTWDIAAISGTRGMGYAYLLENGNLFVVGHSFTDDAPVWLRKGGFLMEVDWQGNVLWQRDEPDQHHDARLLPNGNVLVLCTEVIPAEVAAQVQGGLPPVVEGEMWSDWAKEMTRKGDIVWEWHAWEHLDPETDHINAQDLRDEWTHGNSIEQLPNGNVLLSFRNINTIGIADRESGEFVWKFGPPALAQQHCASYLPNGNVLVFDNGAHRLNTSLPFSRVLEINPETNGIVWQYMDASVMEFFSPLISGAQRLANGNTLIAEGNHGRMFEVTADKEVVWEYVNPFFNKAAIVGESNRVFRAYRYPPEAFPLL